MIKLTAAEILVNDRLGGKRDNLTLVRRALIEATYQGKCNHCNKDALVENLKVYRIYDRPLDNREENLKLICLDCWEHVPKQHWKKASRAGMDMTELASEQIMKIEDKKIMKIIKKL